MTNEEFEKILNERIDKIKATLSSKAKEYASNDDRLHNFNLAAKILDKTAQEALWGMAMKHLVSIIDMVENPTVIRNKPYLDEKIGDMINYLILLEAVLCDFYKSQTE